MPLFTPRKAKKPPAVRERPGSSALTAAIEDACRDPSRLSPEERRRELVELYMAAGSRGPPAVLNTCFDLIKDPSVKPQAKIMAVRVLDLLMEANDRALAKEAAQNLKFLRTFARASKENDSKAMARKTSKHFGHTTDSSEVEQTIGAVCELLDKWGRRYEGETAPGVQEWPNAMQQLIGLGVAFPLSSDYRFLPRDYVPSELAQGAGKPRVDQLDVAEVDRLIDEVHQMASEFGPQDERTGDARVRAESVVSRWQRAAQEAAEKEDFDEFDRVSQVLFRVQEELGRFDREGAQSPQQPQPALSGGDGACGGSGGAWGGHGGGLDGSEALELPSSAIHSGAAPAAAGGGKRRGDRKARRMASREGRVVLPPRGAVAVSGEWDLPVQDATPAFGGSQHTPSFGTWEFEQEGWQQHPPSAPSFENWESEQGGIWGGDRPPQPEAWGVPPLPPPGVPLVSPPPSPPVETWAYEPGGPLATPAAASPVETWAHEPEGGVAAGGGGGLDSSGVPVLLGAGPWSPPGGGDDPHVVRRIAVLEEQAAALRNQIDQVRRAEWSTEGDDEYLMEQLRSAYHRIQELEPFEHQLLELQRHLAEQGKERGQIEHDLDKSRRELHQARRLSGEGEGRLADREDLLQQTRERLLYEESRAGALAEEASNLAYAHLSLRDKLHGTQAEHEYVHNLLHKLKQELGPDRLPLHHGNVPYGCGAHEPQSLDLEFEGPVAVVDESDELATGITKIPPMPGEAERVERVLLERSASEVWAQTPRMAGSPGALVARSPPAPPGSAERTIANFRSLMVCEEGPFYKDDKLTFTLSTSIGSTSVGRPTLEFEAVVFNHGSVPVKQLQLQSMEATHIHACDLKLVSGGGVATALWPHQNYRCSGRLEVFAPFQAGPQMELSYMLADDMWCRAHLRLPLAVTRLLAPAPGCDGERFVQLWESDTFRAGEVAILCPVRGAVVAAGLPSSCARCLEFGGKMCPVPGVVESKGSIVLASLYPNRHGAPPEVLVRAELGGPKGLDRPGAPTDGVVACRLAVRSGSHAVNRALAQAALDVLCDAPRPGAAKW